MMKNFNMTNLVILIAGLLVAAGTVNAGFTSVSDVTATGEAYITDMLDNIYGGTFSNFHNQNAMSYDNGTIVAHRLVSMTIRVAGMTRYGKMELQGLPLRPNGLVGTRLSVFTMEVSSQRYLTTPVRVGIRPLIP